MRRNADRSDGRVRRVTRAASALALVALAAAPLVVPATGDAAKGKKKPPPFQRSSEAVISTGAELPRLLGSSPKRLIAYRYKQKRKRGRWVRVPVQVDERAVIDFGSSPFAGVPTGARTVYGTAPVGATALQYTDPNTFVGADPDATLDADDEVAFMAADAGPRARGKGALPAIAAKAGATAVALRDPIDGAKRWLYLFRAKKDPGPAKPDYVSYSFRLASGEYKASYDLGSGPNPETSSASSAFYSAGFSDRWYFDQLRISGGAANGAEILDGYKFAFSSGGCGRSEASFNAAEGAFVVNKDGPVRAIRSYVGANSGPYTQRTHFLYARRHEIVTDLRVHAVPGPFTHYDLSAAAAGMSYLNQSRQGGALVDGVPDGISGGAPPDWHLWRGAQGSFFLAERVVSSVQASIDATSSFFHQDNSSSPSFAQCWGDADLFGAAGITVAAALPSTDVGSAHFLRSASVNVYAPPGASATSADLWSRQLDAPLAVSPSRLKR